MITQKVNQCEFCFMKGRDALSWACKNEGGIQKRIRTAKLIEVLMAIDAYDSFSSQKLQGHNLNYANRGRKK